MGTIRRVGSAAVACLLLSAFVSGPASAQPLETFLGNAAGRALGLSIANQSLSLGTSSAAVDSTLKAVAESAGALNVPLLSGSNAGKVEVVGNNTSQSTGEKCATPKLPLVGDILNVGVGCSSSLAEVKDNNPHALATGTVARIDLNAQTLAGTPIKSLQNVISPVLGGGPVDQVLQTVNNTVGTDLKVDDTVDELLNALGSVKTLEIELGASKSDVSAVGNKVTSLATSEAGAIRLLPLGVAGLKPVAEIIIGSSSAQAIYDRGTGTSTPSFDPAIVTVRLNTPTTDALSGKIVGVDLREIKIAPDLALPAVGALAAPCADASNEYCVLPGTPLETRIAIASGRTVTNADGTVGAVADAVKIHALKNIGTLVPALAGGIKLELAHAEANVGGAPAQVLALPDLPRELPRTGSTPWIAVAGIGALGMAVITRRVLVRSH
jgi:hypothetical protein